MGMLGSADLLNPHELETIRRSIAMLPANTGRGILNRQESLRLLEALRSALAAMPADGQGE